MDGGLNREGSRSEFGPFMKLFDDLFYFDTRTMIIFNVINYSGLNTFLLTELTDT